MLELRKADTRGKADFGWLKSAHTFSFGSYYDSEHMGFSVLRVINDDTVSPSAGFDTHGHRDMEIISYVTKGVIEHKDSMGNVQRLPAGDFQLMSAGKGVLHSEYNASDKEELKFLQIWIMPNETGGKPGYQQKDFGRAEGLTPIISPSGENGTLIIRQDARLSQLVLSPGQSLSLNPQLGRHGYIHVVEGELGIDDVVASAGDGVKISEQSSLNLSNPGAEAVLALVFDLP